MYTCLTCKTWSRKQGTCWKCSRPMVQTLKAWEPKASIDKKQKSGTRDHLALLSLATRCLLDADLSDEQRDVSEEVAGIDEVVAARWGDSGDGSVARDNVDALKERVREAIRAMSASLGPEHGQLLVNLAMYNYRTAGGGRARKIADWLRMSKAGVPDLISYMRPFDSPLPDTITSILTHCRCDGEGARKGSSDVTLAAWEDGKYVPPSRFTVTFPFKIEQTLEHDPRVVEIEIEKGKNIKYAFMGSFGFAEPAYSTWTAGDEGEGNEYSGTRLSLGAYSLCPDYLVDVLRMINEAEASEDDSHWDGYKRYGGVRRLHVETLCKVARKRGFEVAITWAYQMADIGRSLIGKALEKTIEEARKERDEPEKEKEEGFSYTFQLNDVSRKKALTGLSDFLGAVRQKIERCDAKVGVLEGQGYTLTGFEYVWVQESALWELGVLAASCLSLKEMRAALNEVEALASWRPSVGDDPTFIHEVVNLPDKFVFHRLLAPSGTTAAKKLYDALVELNYGTLSPEIGKKKLDPFTPYFEFYLEEGFLNKHKAMPVARPVGLQIWVNLSDNLHADLLAADVKLSGAAEVIAGKLIEYAGPLSDTGPSNLYVIDYTKFAGEMPHCVVYPILAKLAGLLVRAEIAGKVVFLRSNLKYHTGSLERYQSGEILIPKNAHATALRRLLKEKLETSFNVEANGWDLKGEYVSLMKKVYLLADAVAWLRWTAYAEAYLQSVSRGVLDEIAGYEQIKADRANRLRGDLVATLTRVDQRLAALAGDVSWGYLRNGSLRACIPSVEEFETLLTEVRRRVTQCLERARAQSLPGVAAITILTPAEVGHLEGPFRQLRDVLRQAASAGTTPDRKRGDLLAHFRVLKDAWYHLRKVVPDRRRRPPNPLPAPFSREVRAALDTTLRVLQSCQIVMGNLGKDARGKPFKDYLGKPLSATLRQDAREIEEDIASLTSATEHRFLDSGVRELVELKLRQVAATLPQTLRRQEAALREARRDRVHDRDLKETLQRYEHMLHSKLEGALALAGALPESDGEVPRERLRLGVIAVDEVVQTGPPTKPPPTRPFSIRPVSTPKRSPSLLEKTKPPSSTTARKVGGDGDQHLYTGDEIDALLRLRLSGFRGELYVMVGINAHLHDGYTLADNLREARVAAFLADAEAILLPVHVGGNHWTALYLGFQGDYDSPTAQYADPLGGRDLPASLAAALAMIFPGRTVRPRSNTVYQPAGDGHSCGPWTVALLEHMVLNDGALPALGTYDIAARRRDDTSRIERALDD